MDDVPNILKLIRSDVSNLNFKKYTGGKTLIYDNEITFTYKCLNDNIIFHNITSDWNNTETYNCFLYHGSNKKMLLEYLMDIDDKVK